MTNYEKKYNEALERAKELIAKWTGKNKDFYVEDYAYIFPELRESEDEKNANALISLLNDERVSVLMTYEARQQWLDWLERKRTPSVSFDPPAGFDSGSAVVYHNEESEDERIRKEIIECIETLIKQPGASPRLCDWLAWLEEQKDKNCLACDQHLKGYIAGRKVTEEEKQKESLHISETCKENAGSFTDEDERIRKELIFFLKKEIPQCSIKEHADKLKAFVSYLEKQKEQKPVETSDFKTKLAAYLQNNSPKDGQYVISSESILEMAKDELIKRGELKEQDSVKFEEGFKVGRESGLRDGQKYVLNNLDSYGLCKPAWNEEDEKMRDRIIDILNRTFSVYSALGTSSTRPSCPTYKDEIAWLKSLRPIVNAKSEKVNVNWSEEDEKILDSLIRLYSKEYSAYAWPWANGAFTYGDVVNFLKSLRPQWKPTEEQMDALAYAIQLLDDGLSPKAAKAGEELEHLREQLKKL